MSNPMHYEEGGQDEIRNAMDAFRHPVEDIEPEVREELMSELSNILIPVFLFISKGRLGGTLDMRAWVVLRETKLSYVSGETIEQFASRRGVSAVRVHALVKEFRAIVPTYRSPNRKPETQVRKMSASHRGRIERAKTAATPPPGKESFSGPASSGGSAMP